MLVAIFRTPTGKRSKKVRPTKNNGAEQVDSAVKTKVIPLGYPAKKLQLSGGTMF